MTSQLCIRDGFTTEIASLVLKRARELVQRLIESTGREAPPFLARELALLQGVKPIVKADIGEMDGVLLTLRDGYIIKVNKNHPEVRQNFSIAHEIGHILLHELERQGAEGSVDFRMLGPEGHPRVRERLCDAAAAELLMPEHIFKTYLSLYSVSVNSLEWLAHTFRVSVPAAAIRIAEVSEEPCIAMLWHLQQRARSTGLLLTRRVGPGKQPVDKSRVLTEKVYVTRSSPLFKAYEENGYVKSSKDFIVGGVKKRCYIEAKGFGYSKNRYVVSLAFPNR